MDYQGKYTGAELEALLDRIGEEPYVEVSFSFDECGVTTTKEVSLAGVDNVPGSGDFYLNVFIKVVSGVFSQARLLCHRDVSGVMTSDGVNSQAYQPDGSLRVTFISGINEAGTGVIVTSYPRYDLVFLDETAIIPDIGMNANVHCPRSVIDNAGAVMVVVEEDVPPSEDISFLCNLCCVNDGIAVNGKTTVYLDGKGLVEVSASYDDERELMVVSSRYVQAGGQSSTLPEVTAKVVLSTTEISDGTSKEVLFSDMEGVPESGDFWVNLMIHNGHGINMACPRILCRRGEDGALTTDGNDISVSFYDPDRLLLQFRSGINLSGTGILVVPSPYMAEGYRTEDASIAIVGRNEYVYVDDFILRLLNHIDIPIDYGSSHIGEIPCDVTYLSAGDRTDITVDGRTLASLDDGSLVEFKASYSGSGNIMVSSRYIIQAATE